ncbi:MAG: type II secretion system F family protein, partial [Gammaproteobacteria bacterium]
MAQAATYAWEGTNKQGKIIRGETTATSIDAVKAELRKRGVTPKPGKVKRKGKSMFAGKGKKITPGDIAVFSRQMATMMKAGVPLVQAFDIVGQGHSNKNMTEMILQVKADVEAGGTFANALSKHPLHFDDLFINLVDAGEASGALEELLDKIATYKEKTEALKSKIKKALTYPISVLVVAIVVTAILLIFVVPTFSSLFEGFGAELPAFTQMVVDLSDFMIAWGWLLGLGIIGVIVGFIQIKKRSRKFREKLDVIVLKIPAFGPLIFNSAIARFSRTLSTMFSAGVPLVDAMASVAGSAGNSVFTKEILRVRDDIASGTTLQASLAQNKALFPNMLIQMVGIGEE